MRSTYVPPCLRAQSQWKSAVRALPIWRYPVGDGANRTRMVSVMIDPRLSHASRSHASPAGYYFLTQFGTGTYLYPRRIRTLRWQPPKRRGKLAACLVIRRYSIERRRQDSNLRYLLGITI